MTCVFRKTFVMIRVVDGSLCLAMWTLWAAAQGTSLRCLADLQKDEPLSSCLMGRLWILLQKG